MSVLKDDLRFAFRSLRRSRGTTSIAVLCLALGIGANTAIFSVVRAVLLQALPYGDAGQLVSVNESSARVHAGSVSTPLFHDLEEQRATFESVSAWGPTSRDLGDPTEPERLSGVRASTNLFTTLRAQPVLGRTFTTADAPPDGAPAVVISERLWQRRFGGDRAIIGRVISLDNIPYTVIGVMPSAFDFPLNVSHNDFWIPLDFRSIGNPMRNNRSLQIVGRLRPGLDSASATTQLGALARRLEVEFPESNKDRGLLVRPFSSNVVGSVRPALLTLAGAVGLVLLIACANVANLTLVRAAGRRRELAVRTALGANRSRLVRQLLTESAVVALTGGLLGVAVAWYGLHAIVRLAHASLPRADQVGMHPGVFAFAMIVSLATGVIVGLLPALRASNPDLRSDLAEGSKSSGSIARHATLRALIIGEIALSVTLLAGAGLVIRSFVALLDVDPGFRAENVLTFAVAAPRATVVDTSRYAAFFGPLRDRLLALPGVRAVGMTNVLPVSGGTTDRFMTIIGSNEPTDVEHRPDAQFRVIGPDYFKALGIPVVIGREFGAADRLQSPHVAVINDELAKRYFANSNPIGRQFSIVDNDPLTIVGVVRSVHEVGLDQPTMPEFYVPATQTTQGTQVMTLVISASGDPAALERETRRVVHEFAPSQPVFGLATMRGILDASLAGRRVLLALLAVFAVLALVLAAAGVYGVMSYAVAQRTREIGIRIALGATTGNVAGMVLRSTLVIAGVGLAIGIVVSLILSRSASSLLYGVSAADSIALGGAAMALAITALGAAAVPALRASRVDALTAMRAE